MTADYAKGCSDGVHLRKDLQEMTNDEDTMTKYHLDTVAVRSLAGLLTNHAGACYTSVFVVLETIFGIVEMKYASRRAKVRHLFASSVHIDERLPIDLVLASFDLRGPDNAITYGDIKAIVDALIACSGYGDFAMRNKPFNRMYWLKVFDQKLSAEFEKAFKRFIIILFLK